MEKLVKIRLDLLRCRFESFKKDPRLMVLHRRKVKYKRVKKSLSKGPLLNPLIVCQKDPPYYANKPTYEVKVGLAMLELDNYYLDGEINCIVTDDDSPANLKILQAKYKIWKGK